MVTSNRNISRTLLGVRTSCTGSVTVARNLLDNQYYSYTDTVRRPKPKGLELYFSPTYPTHHRSQSFDMMDGVFFPLSCDPTGSRGFETNSGYGSWGLSRPTVQPYEFVSSSPILGKVKNSPVNLALFSAEFRKTAAMFPQMANQLHSVYRAVRSGSPILAKGVRSLPGTWLLYRYGIRPLVMDVYGMMDAFLDYQNGHRSFVRRYSVVSNNRGYTASPRGYQPAGSTKPVYRDFHRLWHVRTKDVAWVEYKSDNILSATAFGLTNPLAVAYELIPFSFVLDWFINIGQYLETLDALTGVSRIKITRTTKTRLWEINPIGTGTAAWYQRTGVPATPTLPKWEPSLSWQRIVDGLALAKNLRR